MADIATKVVCRNIALLLVLLGLTIASPSSAADTGIGYSVTGTVNLWSGPYGYDTPVQGYMILDNGHLAAVLHGITCTPVFMTASIQFGDAGSLACSYNIGSDLAGGWFGGPTFDGSYSGDVHIPGSFDLRAAYLGVPEDLSDHKLSFSLHMERDSAILSSVLPVFPGYHLGNVYDFSDVREIEYDQIADAFWILTNSGPGGSGTTHIYNMSKQGDVLSVLVLSALGDSSSPGALAYDPLAKLFYVSETAAGRVYKVGLDGTVQGSFALAGICALTYCAERGTLFAGAGTQLYEVTTDGVVLHTLTMQGDIAGLGIKPSSQQLYFIQYPYGHIWRTSLDLDAPVLESDLQCSHEITDLSFDMQGNVYVSGLDMIWVYTQAPQPIELSVLAQPGPIALATSKKLFTCLIGLPQAYDMAQIDQASLRLSLPDCSTCGDEASSHGTRQGSLYAAQFDLSLLRQVPTGDVNIKIAGHLTDGTPFEGTTTIQTWKPLTISDLHATDTMGRAETQFAVNEPVVLACTYSIDERVGKGLKASLLVEGFGKKFSSPWLPASAGVNSAGFTVLVPKTAKPGGTTMKATLRLRKNGKVNDTAVETLPVEVLEHSKMDWQL